MALTLLLFRGGGGTGGPTTLNASPGVWTWAGLQSGVAVPFRATPGTWFWTGSTASFTDAIAASPGVYTWSGVAAALAQIFQVTPAGILWSGNTAVITNVPTFTAPSAYRRYQAQFHANIARAEPLTRQQTILLVDHLQKEQEAEDDEDDDFLLF